MSQQHRHVLVIGGAGYIGSVLTRKLLDHGYCVRVLDVLLYDNAEAISQLLDRPGFTFQRGDFCRESDLNATMEGITDVVLLAALVGDPVCRKFPDLARRINETGTLALVDRLNRFDLERFVFMSTCSNYGLRRDDTPATEESDLHPQSLYAETKVRVEKHILDRVGQLNFSATILRSATAYGLSPRMRFDLTVNEFTRELALGHELLVYDADTWRPYCHVDDISSAVLKVLEYDASKVRGQVFNVGNDAENYTKQMIIDLICALLPDSKIQYRTGAVDPRNYRVDFGKIISTLGFRSIHTVAQFAPELIEAVRAGRFDLASESPGYYANVSPSFPNF